MNDALHYGVTAAATSPNDRDFSDPLESYGITIFYVVHHWPKCHYAGQECIYKTCVWMFIVALSMNLKCTLINKAVLKGYIVRDSIYVTFWKGKNCRDGKQISGYQGLGVTRLTAQEFFRTVKLLCMILS